MSRSTVAGLQSALRLYESDKVRERTDGQNRIREIFSNRENLLAFQESASKDGGTGWIAIFQCLFQAVITERKAWLRKSAGPQTERRLGDAISLVRWMAERSVPYISRKPLISLVTHMVHLLVYSNAIFQPAALDYAKALRALLSYPPHLENLDPEIWKVLMGICWSALLGDEISIEEMWDEGLSTAVSSATINSPRKGQFNDNGKSKAPILSQSTMELVNLIPILLSSSSIPLIPSLPPSDGTHKYEPSLGLSILNKVIRFIQLYPTETGSHLPVLRSMNVVLAELEMNCRHDLINGGTRLFPLLVGMWTLRNKAIREQILIAFRILIPFVLGMMLKKEQSGIARDPAEKLMESLSKESTSRWGFEPLNLNAVRFRLQDRDAFEENTVGPFETRVMTAGFDFTHDQALRWAIVEMYSECAFQLHLAEIQDGPSMIRDGKRAKRRKITDSLTSLIRSTSHGSFLSRLHALQVLIMIIDRHWSAIVSDVEVEIRQAVLSLLEEENAALQSWAFVACTTLVTYHKSAINVKTLLSASESGDEPSEGFINRVWSHSMRKLNNPPLSRTAAHAAHAIICYKAIDAATSVKDIGFLLQAIDIQGPPYPHDSVCALLTSAVTIARHDVRLYTMSLEDKAVSYMAKWNALEGTRGKGRMDQHVPSDILPFLNTICHFQPYPISPPATVDFLPDCAIVDRVLEEQNTFAIRQFNFYGKIPDVRSHGKHGQSNDPSIQSTQNNGALVPAEGRVLRVTEILNSLVKTFFDDWTTRDDLETRPAVPPERCRRGVDFLVLNLAFNGTLQLNGIKPQDSHLEPLSKLIDLLLPTLRSAAYDIPAQHLIWKGFEPLIRIEKHPSHTWPMLLQPNEHSGIRPDLLPRNSIDLHEEDELIEDPLLRILWGLASVSESLQMLLAPCLDLFAGVQSVQITSGTQYAVIPGQEEDDFGEIRTAEADAMPLSREAMECRRTARSLLSVLSRMRLRGAALLSASGYPPRDIQLINAFLQADGQRMIQLGTAVAECVRADLIRLNAKAVDSIFSVLVETSSSYAYRDDEGLLQLILNFVMNTAHIWLAPENADTRLAQRILHVTKDLQARSMQGQLPSWKVRLALLELVDEYLDYDPDMVAWNDISQSAMVVDEADGGATDVISGALVDIDMRLRVRAATSTAGLLYLTSIPLDQHSPFYHTTVDSLPREPRHWDSFITDILWKLNCCITSPQLRAATIYHLYEISPSTREYDHHLQNGLDTVARRLGLSGIAPLYLAHSPLVISSQICTQQSPLRIPPMLYGLPDLPSYARATLERAAPTVLIDSLTSKTFDRARAGLAREVYRDLCEAAGVSEQETTERYLSATLASAFTMVETSNLFSSAEMFAPEGVLQLLKGLPGLDKSTDLASILTPLANAIITETLILLDTYLSNEDIAAILEAKSTKKGAEASIFLKLMPNNDPTIIATPPLVPSASIDPIFHALDFIQKRFPNVSPSKILFNTLIRLYHQVNQDFLISEQYRRIRTICVVISIYHDVLPHPAILGLLLRESLSLLPMVGIGHIALSLLRFGFSLIRKSPTPPDDLDELVLRLGTVYRDLVGGPEQESVRNQLDSWIAESAPVWVKADSFKSVLGIAKSTWPDALASHLSAIPEPTFVELCEHACKGSNVDILPICAKMVKILPDSGSIQSFQWSFWHIKDVLSASADNQAHISAFIDLLYATNGQIHPPDLDQIRRPRDDHLALLRTRSKEDPSPYLRAAIVDKIVKMAGTSDFQARSSALRMLQSLVPYIGDLITRSLLPQSTLELLSLLNPLHTTATNSPSVVRADLEQLVQGSEWSPKTDQTSDWAMDLAIALCGAMAPKQPFFKVLPDLFTHMGSAAQEFLPLLVQSVLSCWEKSEAETLKQRFRNMSTYFTIYLQHPTASPDTLRLIVDVVLHLRNFHPHYRSDDLGYDNWLDMDMVLLSEAALKCGAFATALMFLELARNVKGQAVDQYDPTVQKIMYATYSNVEDPDGFYGIKTRDVGDALHRRLQHEGEHWRSLGLHSAALEPGLKPSAKASGSLLVMRDLHNLGFNQVANAIFGGLRNYTAGTDESSEPLLFELAWRTGDWDLPVPSNVMSSESLLYSSLRAVHRERDLTVAQKVVRNAIGIEIGRLKNNGVERMAEIKKTVTDLICLRETELWLELEVFRTQPNSPGGIVDQTVLERFGTIHTSFPYVPSLASSCTGELEQLTSAKSFSDAEKIIATRRSLINAAKEREYQNFFGDLATDHYKSLVSLETSCVLRVGEMARTEGNIQASINAVVAVQHLERESGHTTDAVEDEFGEVLWAQSEHLLAIQHLEARMAVFKQGSKDGSRLASLLSRAANWTSKAKLRAPHSINSTFEEAVRLSQAHKISYMEQSQLFFDYATFADSQQAAISRSPEFERLTGFVENKGADLQSASPALPAKRSIKGSHRTEMSHQLEKEIMEDEQAAASLLAQRSAYTKTALKMYATALALSDDHDDSTTRMCSLWLEYDGEEEVNTSFRGPLAKVPSHKFIFLSPQLAARLDKPRTLTAFNKILNALVLRISQQHPYHILYQVITIAEGAPHGRGKRASDVNMEGRAPAAAQVMEVLATETENHMALTAMKQMKILAESATKWCLSRSKEEEKTQVGKAIAVPSSCPLRTLVNLNIPCPTTLPPIDPLCQYIAIPTLVRYRSSYSVLGGIHRPKRMQVYDSVGQIHKELFKGEDEIRQDAVMEQVFEMSNKLLTRDRKTRTRALRFRTYVVIPLAKKTGIMEFVGDSQAIGDWLKPAHGRYGKIYGDIPADDFRRNLKPLQEKEQDWDKLPKQYSSMIEQFHPVMRHFFTEKHRDPMAWFTMRLKYTRSAAVTSVVGWMLGIGDRHCSNILIDQKSGELVHIDFGIVFEDGRRLRIPEKVPFRLTPDIVDGFGLTGVDGTFRRCSEHTLRVLRESSELIMTVLEVFKHDPLYAWDADPEKLQRAQGGGRVTTGTSVSALEKADRILSKIKIKLGDDLSIEYTVNQLIQEARDVDNLAKIFVGWQPWF